MCMRKIYNDWNYLYNKESNLVFLHDISMKRKTRRILFYVSIFIFLVISFMAVLFALGYKYDFVQNKFFKTGSFALKSNVDAQVYINDNLVGSTSFLTHSFSQGRFLPRTYNVRLQTDNYQPWEKLISIEAGYFADFPRVILIPGKIDEVFVASSSFIKLSHIQFQANDKSVLVGDGKVFETISLDGGQKMFTTPTPKPSPTTKTVKASPSPSPLPRSFSGQAQITSPDEGKTLWFNDHEIWIEWIKDANFQPYRKAGETELVTRFSQKIQDVQWYKDSAHLIANVGGILKFIEVDDRGGLNIYDLATVTSPFYYDKGLDAVFLFEGPRLLRINI